MKRINLLMLIALLTTAFTFSACSSSDDDSVNPNQAAVDAFNALYPDATTPKWETKGTYYVAECRIENKDADVWFTANGVWQMTELDITYEQLPDAVKTSFEASEYASWKIDDVDELRYSDGSIQYVIEVEQGKFEYDLFYDELGNLLYRDDKNNSENYEHWPNNTGSTTDMNAALKAKYPNAILDEWERKGSYLIAECDIDRVEADVWFDADLNWVMTEFDWTFTKLSTAIQTAFLASEYANWELDDVDKLEYVSGTIYYVIEVERGNTEIQLFYNENGNLVSTKDVTIADDTHWPEV